MLKVWILGAALGEVIVLAGCGSSNMAATTSPIHVAKSISVPNVAAGTNFSFDISAVDSAAGRYYLADRNNKSIDVVDIKTNQLIASIAGFAGCMSQDSAPLAGCSGAVANSRSGPNGVNVIPGTNYIYAGDVNAVQILDKTTFALFKKIEVSMTGFRVDEGCFDSDDNLFMISSPEETPPVSTFIDTVTATVVATVTFTDAAGSPAAGLEQCGYDHGTRSFYVNNDGTTANGHGELDVFPASSITALPAGESVNYTNLTGLKTYSEGNCDPTGLAFGPGNDMAIDCRPGTVGSPMNVLILDRTNGSLLATVNAGGGDQLAYDAVSNLYLVAASRWTTSGNTMVDGAACSPGNVCTPVLNVIDAATRAVLARVPTGNNAHSVAVDGSTHQVYVPYSSAAVPVGAMTAANFASGGISVIALQ